MNQTMDNEERREKQDQWIAQLTVPLRISGILFALDLVFIQNLVQTADLPLFRLLSLIFFVLALPLLGCNAYVCSQMIAKKKSLPGPQRAFGCVRLGGYLASWLAVLFSVDYVSPVAAIIFLIVSIFASSFTNRITEKL